MIFAEGLSTPSVQSQKKIKKLINAYTAKLIDLLTKWKWRHILNCLVNLLIVLRDMKQLNTETGNSEIASVNLK